MLVNDSSGETISLLPLAKWLSKRFNLPLKRDSKRPKDKKKREKINGFQEPVIAPKTDGKIGKIQKIKKEKEVVEESLIKKETIDSTEDVDYSKVEALKKRATANKAFVSTDATENADIASEEWNQLKSLTNDNERMSHAMLKFGNKRKGEPNRNMSIHGFKRATLARNDSKHLELRNENKANVNFYEKRRLNIVQIKEGKIETTLTDPQLGDSKNKKRKAGDHDEMPKAKKPKLVKFKDYEEKIMAALIKYKKPKLGDPKDKFDQSKILKYWRYYLRHFKCSMEETKAFFQYYSEFKDSDNNCYMTQDELKANICQEMIFYQFTLTYGNNPVSRCKDCEEVDKTMGREVLHPY